MTQVTLADGLADKLYMELVEKLKGCTERESHPDGCDGCDKFKASNIAFNGLCERTLLRETTKERYDYYLKKFIEIGCIRGMG